MRKGTTRKSELPAGAGDDQVDVLNCRLNLVEPDPPEGSIELKLTEPDIADDIVVGDFGPLQPIQQNQ